MNRNDHMPALRFSFRANLGMVIILIWSVVFFSIELITGIAEAVTYNMQQSNGDDLGGYTSDLTGCSNFTTPRTTSMNQSGSNACTSGRVGTTSSGPLTILTVISDTAYSVATSVTGGDVTGYLRDYQESSNPGTTDGISYELGYVSGGIFTSFGSVNEARDYSSTAYWTTDLSSLSGIAPAGSRLALTATKLNTGTTEYRYYFTSTSLVLNVTEEVVANPGITVNPTSGLTTTEAGGQDTFTIVLDSPPTSDVTIGLSSSDTSEGTVYPESVTFTTGNWSTPQTVTVTGADDMDQDGGIEYTIITAAATSADSNYNGLNASDVSVTNLDNEPPPIRQTPAGNYILFAAVLLGILVYGYRKDQGNGESS